MFYTIRTPGWIKWIFRHSTWEIKGTGKKIFLSFDDGPHPHITPFVLDELKKYHAKATFFCIGKNVVEHPETYNRILQEGHAVGNHSYNHLNGWKTSCEDYLENIEMAAAHIDSQLFRPPYGRITHKQHRQLRKRKKPFSIIMWSVLSGDFDVNITAMQCSENVTRHAKSGSVIVFHDSEKAFDRLKYALPVVLKDLSERGFQFEKIGA